MVIFVCFGPSLFKGSILARMSPNLQGELAQKSHEPSRAEKPLARAGSELNRAELSSDASLLKKYQTRTDSNRKIITEVKK